MLCDEIMERPEKEKRARGKNENSHKKLTGKSGETGNKKFMATIFHITAGKNRQQITRD